MKSSDVVRALAPADQAGEDEPLSALMYPLRFLGMGLLIAWLCCTHVASIFPGDVFDPALRSAFDTGMRIGDIGTFLAFVLFAPRIGRLSRHKAFRGQRSPLRRLARRRWASRSFPAGSARRSSYLPASSPP